MRVSWLKLLNEHSPQALEFWGTLIVQIFFFWIPSLLYSGLDYAAPQFSQRHKLQPQFKQPTTGELKDCLRTVLRNQVISAFIHIALLAVGALSGGKPTYRFDLQLPSPSEIARDVLICIFLREILFYYSHRLLHLPSLYP